MEHTFKIKHPGLKVASGAKVVSQQSRRSVLDPKPAGIHKQRSAGPNRMRTADVPRQKAAAASGEVKKKYKVKGNISTTLPTTLSKMLVHRTKRPQPPEHPLFRDYKGMNPSLTNEFYNS